MNHGDTSSHPDIAARIVPSPPPSHSSCRFGQLGTASDRAGQPPAAPSIAGDILYGADAIAEFMFGAKENRRAVYNLIQKRSIPHFRIGASVCARKSVLLAWIGEQETSRRE